MRVRLRDGTCKRRSHFRSFTLSDHSLSVGIQSQRICLRVTPSAMRPRASRGAAKPTAPGPGLRRSGRPRSRQGRDDLRLRQAVGDSRELHLVRPSEHPVRRTLVQKFAIAKDACTQELCLWTLCPKTSTAKRSQSSHGPQLASCRPTLAEASVWESRATAPVTHQKIRASSERTRERDSTDHI